MKALTVRQPWAWAIIYANKDIENRGWPIYYKGEILIHAAKNFTKKEYQQAALFCESMGVVVPEPKLLARGEIIGKVTLTGCLYSKTASGWGMAEQYHWHLTNPKALAKLTEGIAPIPYIGRLGLFDVPDDLIVV